MSRATVLLVLAALSYGGCKAATSEPCIIADQTATCDGEKFEFPLNLPENITQLHMHSTQVKNISKDNFAQYNELEVIDLSNCDITDIDPDTFTALSNLNELNFAGNKEFSIEQISISSQSLTKLNLSETGIETIPENFFEGLPNLKELDLSSTSLTETPINALITSNLSTLIISKDYKDELNNFCNEIKLQTIVFKTVDGDIETYDCSDLKVKDTTTAQEDITTVPNIIVNQSESDDGTKAENPDVDQTKENDGTTTESNKDDGTTAILDDSTEDKNDTVVAPPEELESVKTLDEKPKDDEQEQNKIDDAVSTAEKIQDNETPPEVLDRNVNTEIESVVTNNETAKADEPETENVVQDTSEPVTENVAEKTDKPVTENVNDPTQSDNGTEATTTNRKIVNDQDTRVFSNIANPQMNNNNNSAGADNTENIPSGSTSSAAQSSGTNVVLGIILTVMVIGAVGFGYKYWKNRKSGYRNANTEETHEDGKELQTIVTHTDPEQN